MIEFSAAYFDGKTSAAHPVRVSLEGSWLRIRGEGIALEFGINDCQIVPALGRTRRVIRLPGGAKLESEDLAAVAELERHLGRNLGMTLVGRLEERWRWVILALVGLVLFTAAFLRWGIPAVAHWAAFVTPIEVMNPISQQTLRVLDDRFLQPTQLSPSRQAELQRLFADVTQTIGQNHSYSLEFRQSDLLGANAFALPSGIIVLTDELVKLAQSDREIAGVMAHEVGHVLHRHSLQQIYRSVGVILVISVLLGDVTSVTSIGASLPAVLVESGYSREFEYEADAVAAEYLNRKGWGTKPLIEILIRLSTKVGGSERSLLSTHPATEDRVRALEKLAQPNR
jgi:Zn-dependent protease with chaperone function